MPGGIGVHDEHTALLLYRTGQYRCPERYCPKARRLKVGHGEVQMQLLRNTGRPFRRPERVDELECQLESRLVDVHLAPFPVAGVRPAAQKVCIERRQGTGIGAIEDH